MSKELSEDMDKLTRIVSKCRQAKRDIKLFNSVYSDVIKRYKQLHRCVELCDKQIRNMKDIIGSKKYDGICVPAAKFVSIDSDYFDEYEDGDSVIGQILDGTFSFSDLDSDDVAQTVV